MSSSKKVEIFFKPIGGSAPLSIYFHQGNLGDAVEALNEIGVGWFAPNGELLAVQFDDVNENDDSQMLKFKDYSVQVKVKNGKITYKLTVSKKSKDAVA
jgi:hypothetical protein